MSSARMPTVLMSDLPVILCATRVSTERSSDIMSKLLISDPSSSESVELAVVYQSPTGEDSFVVLVVRSLTLYNALSCCQARPV